MRRLAISAIILVALCGLLAYTSGVLTGDERHEESCVLCRAVRYTGRHYGFGYETLQDTVMTTWYRANIDPRHGLDPEHPHTWEQSASTVTTAAGGGETESEAVLVAPLFLMRPEIERAALNQIPDKQTQVDLMRSLNVPSRREAMTRVRLLIEYFYIEQPNTPWPKWWQVHARDFGLVPPTPPEPPKSPKGPKTPQISQASRASQAPPASRPAVPPPPPSH